MMLNCLINRINQKNMIFIRIHIRQTTALKEENNNINKTSIEILNIIKINRNIQIFHQFYSIIFYLD